MDKTICRALFLIVTVSCAPPLRCQPAKDKLPVPPTEAARWTNMRYVYEVRVVTVQTKPDGSTDTQEGSDLTAVDSQGRLLFEARSVGGFRRFTVDDPVAGTRTVWNSDNRQAKVLAFPTAVPGRDSCWTVPVEELHVA